MAEIGVMMENKRSNSRRYTKAADERDGIFVGDIYRVLFLLMSVLVLSRCSTGDDLDVCCHEVVLKYRYVRSNADEYEGFIQSMRHFLFDDRGHFMREVRTSSSRTVRLSKLPAGRYTVVTVANTTPERTKLSSLVPGDSCLEDFRLSVADVGVAEGVANADPLYWNEITFEAEPDRRYEYVCDLSNIHCQLFVKVAWHGVPPYLTGPYTLILDRVPADYRLSPEHIHHSDVIRARKPSEPDDRQVTHTFPGLGGRFAKHRLSEDLFGVSLYGRFVTLRYTNDHIPVFRLAYDGHFVTKPIDLTKAFASWGWHPDEHPEQVYRIKLEIFDDGSIIVEQWFQTSVKDWVNGGTIGA